MVIHGRRQARTTACTAARAVHRAPCPHPHEWPGQGEQQRRVVGEGRGPLEARRLSGNLCSFLPNLLLAYTALERTASLQTAALVPCEAVERGAREALTARRLLCAPRGRTWKEPRPVPCGAGTCSPSGPACSMWPRTGPRSGPGSNGPARPPPSGPHSPGGSPPGSSCRDGPD